MKWVMLSALLIVAQPLQAAAQGRFSETLGYMDMPGGKRCAVAYAPIGRSDSVVDFQTVIRMAPRNFADATYQIPKAQWPRADDLPDKQDMIRTACDALKADIQADGRWVD